MVNELCRRWFAIPLSVRWAGCLWFALVAGVTGRVLTSPPTSQTVVPIYLTGGEHWASGEPLYAYNPLADHDVYRNPPGFAAVFAVLTPLPEKMAGIVWRLTSAAVFLFALVRFRRFVVPGWSADRAALMFGLAVLVALPAVNNGQVNLLIAAAAMGGTAAAVAGRWWEAAGWFALGGWLKVYPLAVGLLAGLIAPRQLMPRLLLVTAAGFAVPFVLADPSYVADQYRAFVTSQTADDRTLADLTRAPRDWTVVTRSWLDWVPPPEVTRAVMLTTAAICAIWVALWRSRPGAFGLALALGLTWMTVFGPATEAHTYAQLAGLSGWLVAATVGRSRWAFGLAVVGYGLLAGTVMRAMFPADWKLTVLGPQAVGATVLAVTAVLMTRRGVADVSGSVLVAERLTFNRPAAFAGLRMRWPFGTMPANSPSAGPRGKHRG